MTDTPRSVSRSTLLAACAQRVSELVSDHPASSAASSRRSKG